MKSPGYHYMINFPNGWVHDSARVRMNRFSSSEEAMKFGLLKLKRLHNAAPKKYPTEGTVVTPYLAK